MERNIGNNYPIQMNFNLTRVLQMGFLHLFVYPFGDFMVCNEQNRCLGNRSIRKLK